MEHTQTVIRLVLGLGLTAVVLLFAARRVWWLASLVRSGQPATGRTDQLGQRIKTQVEEVFGQTRLLRWSIPGLAHFFTMWGFFILLTVYIEAYGVLFNPKFAIPFIGRWPALGFIQDFFALAVLLGITTFAIIRLRSEPKEYGRAVTLLRLAHRRRVADPVHDLQRHLDLCAVPRVVGQQRQPSL